MEVKNSVFKAVPDVKTRVAFQRYVGCRCDRPRSHNCHLGQREFPQHNSQIPCGLPSIYDFPAGILQVTRDRQSSQRPPKALFQSSAFVVGTDTHQYGEIHAALVWTVIPPEGCHSDFDGVARLVARPVRLDKTGDVPGAEGKGGAVGENQAIPFVAPHRQVEQGLC